jgi:hypothetical protein
MYQAALEHVDEAQTPWVSSFPKRKGYQHSVRRNLKVGAQ